ncbi:MAG: hypothetical protein GXW99_02565 [Clostridiales bacterium]|nr:hypothetical protein [Clostridiales bacterium]
MFGYIDWQETGKGRVALRRESICGVCFLTIEVGRRGGLFFDRRLRRTIGKMKEAGVRRAVFPQHFPWEDAFRAAGIVPLPEEGLRARLLEQLVYLTCVEEKMPLSAATAAIYATGETKEACQAGRLLAEKCRYLRLSFQNGSRELERELRFRYGVSPSSAGQKPDLIVSFLDEPPTAEKTPVIDLGRNCRRQIITYELPPETVAWIGDRPVTSQLITALFEAGRLSLEAIRVKTLTFFA